MRLVLVGILALIFAITIVFQACDKSTDIDTDNPPEDNFLCGDANGDEKVDLLDITRLVCYLYLFCQQLDTNASDIDNIRGITLNDIIYLWNYLYLDGSLPRCSKNIPDTVLPISPDTIIISNRIVPPGEQKWRVDISLKMTNTIQAISFPFHYDCLDTSIVCDSVLSYKVQSNHKFSNSGLFNCPYGIVPIDTVNQKSIFVWANTIDQHLLDTVLIGSIWFSLTPSVESQTIVIDTTTFPPSNIVIMSRFEYPETIASVPVIVFQE